MATKSSTNKKSKSTNKKVDNKHDLLYIMSPTCGWCKKSDPIVDELISEGHKITKLDVTIPEEAKRANDIKQKFNAQCGTPLFLDAETGNQICGFREKDVLEKWVGGEEIPKPPQPKTPPPPPPTDLDNEDMVSDFKSKYEQWVKDNDHMPKLLTFEQVIQRLTQQRAMRAQQAQQAGNQAGTAPTAPPPAQDGEIIHNLNHYYIVENNVRSAVVADESYIRSIVQQYYFRENDGRLTKVIGDKAWDAKNNTAPIAKPNAPKTPQQPPQVAKKEIPAAVKAKIEEKTAKLKEEKEVASKAKTAKSKSNKKTVAGF